MGTTQPNPIYQRLTRDIDPVRHRRTVRLARAAPVIVVTLVSVLLVFSPNPNPSLVGLAILVVILSMITMSAAAGLLSSNMTHGEIQGESLKLIQLTTITNRNIIDGFVQGVTLRLRPLRVAAGSLALSVFIAPFLSFVVLEAIYAIMSSVSLSSILPIGTLFYVVFVLVLPTFYVFGLVTMFVDTAILAGIYSAMRFHKSGAGLSGIGAASSVLFAEILGPLATILCAVGLYNAVSNSTFLLWTIMTIMGIVITFFVPSFSSTLISRGMVKYLERARMSLE